MDTRCRVKVGSAQVRYKDYFIRLDYDETVRGTSDIYYYIDIGSSKPGRPKISHIPVNPRRWFQ